MKYTFATDRWEAKRNCAKQKLVEAGFTPHYRLNSGRSRSFRKFFVGVQTSVVNVGFWIESHLKKQAMIDISSIKAVVIPPRNQKGLFEKSGQYCPHLSRAYDPW